MSGVVAMAEPRILVGASQLGWVTALTQWIAEHGGARLVGQALTSVDVIDVEFDALILDGWSSLLSRRLVSDVHRRGAAVIVLVNHDATTTAQLEQLGVTVSLPLDATPERIVARAAEVAAVRNHMPAPPPSQSSVPVEPSSSQLVVVLGDRHATELAVNLAALTASRQRVVVADFDTIQPSLAVRLNTPVAPNLITVSDALRADEFDRDATTRHSGGFDVIAGIANPRDWDTLGSVEAREILTGLATVYDTCVLLVDHNLEALAPLSGLEGRFDVARLVVDRADQIIVCVPLSPAGLVAALTRIADVRALTDSPVHVVADGPSHTRFFRTQWAGELQRSVTPASVSFPRFDKAEAAAVWDGRVHLNGRYAKDITALAAALDVGVAA
jgi:hypothetical protein